MTIIKPPKNESLGIHVETIKKVHTQTENEPRNLGGTLPIIVLFLLFACSFTNRSSHSDPGKKQVESGFVSHHDPGACLTVKTFTDRAFSMASAVVKHAVCHQDKFKKMHDTRMAGNKMASLKNTGNRSGPANIFRFYPLFHYHTPVTDEYPILG